MWLDVLASWALGVGILLLATAVVLGLIAWIRHFPKGFWIVFAIVVSIAMSVVGYGIGETILHGV